ncbi:MAG TPA: hypothetical protein PK076_09235 [Saprospiraceae bacterium]|nr:hypothetical protein [Saprospiraceae bacterium]
MGKEDKINQLTTDEINNILNVSINNVKHLLEEFGEFYPFGIDLDESDQMNQVNLSMESDFPASKEMFDILEQDLLQRIKKGEARAVTICLQIERAEIGSIACIKLFHKIGISLDHYLPYEIINSKVIYGEDYTEMGSLYIN